MIVVRLVLVFMVTCGTLLIGVAAWAADPHDHGVTVPNWYDPSCCSYNDCHPVADADVVFFKQEDGMAAVKYLPTGNIFPLTHFRHSQDERYHVCINPRSRASLCFYDRGGF